MLEQRIQQQFFDVADLEYQSAETLSRPIADAARSLLGCITAGGKVLLAADGASVAIAQAMTAQLVGRFERERPGLAAIALGTDAAVAATVLADAPSATWLAKQVQALGAPGDVLVAIAAGADSVALREAIAAARAKELTVVALLRRGSALAARVGETDVVIAVPHERAARVHEVHLLVVHCLCDALDLQLMGEQDPA